MWFFFVFVKWEDVVITLWLNVWKWFLEKLYQKQQQKHWLNKKKERKISRRYSAFCSMTMGVNRVKLQQLTIAFTWTFHNIFNWNVN